MSLHLGHHSGKHAAPPALKLDLLPQVCGYGYYSYSAIDRQYGTADAVQTVVDVCLQFQMNNPGRQAGIGDMSFKAGGHMAPHHSHKNGRCIDFRPFRTDAAMGPVTIHDKIYDHAITELLIQAFLAHRNVQKILFNDSKIKGVHHFAGHHNHFHLETKA